MGVYLNPGGDKFCEALNSKIYVDKSELLAYTNSVVKTSEKFVCVSRPRRFGKSMTANMVAAYYDRTASMEKEFSALKIGGDPSFAAHVGKYDVVQVNVQVFLSNAENMQQLLALLQKSVLRELIREYPTVDYLDKTNLIFSMQDVYAETRRPFVIVIDEWDSIFREYQNNKDWQRQYLDFLRAWLKDQSYVGLAYMTGILPIKKYGTHSALNMFREFSMTNPGKLAEYAGFTEQEVAELCARFHMDLTECRRWYDGYHLPKVGSVYCPRSVVASLEDGECAPYWNQTETFEALKVYIDLNYDGLREAVIALMAGETVRVNPYKFSNDMTTFNSKDDVLTLLIHLGYLGFNFAEETVYIPNQELMLEYGNAVEDDNNWDMVAKAVKAAGDLLTATLAKDSDAVARGIAEAHLETSHLQYNDENALSYTISLAYYTARQKYLLIRELPTGKGFADLVFLPRPKQEHLPALILELKWDKAAQTAIRQIKTKDYPKTLQDFQGRMLLVGVSYDKGSRRHECLIEEWEKS